LRPPLVVLDGLNVATRVIVEDLVDELLLPTPRITRFIEDVEDLPKVEQNRLGRALFLVERSYLGAKRSK
jgi:hypothetical protein